MTIEEKLVIFEESAINAATEKRTEIVSEYERNLKADYENKKHLLNEKAALKLKTQSEELKRKSNQMLSTEILNAKRLTSEKAVALTNALFDDVKEKLLEFKKTPQYEKLLIDQILYAIDFSENMPMTVYLDESDKMLAGKLWRLTNQELSISNTSFLGGTKAVIHEKNILIDNSFLTRMNELKEEFML